MADLVGKPLGAYRILERLGEGGMATVYRAHQPSLNRYVAIKVLSEQLGRDKEVVERFLREARAAAKLRHPNIIDIYDVGHAGEWYYIVMDYVDGGSLAAKLKREGALDVGTALSIVRQIGSALDYAHAHGVVHRDVKPSNILLTAQGQAILSDFGIARAAAEARLTRTGMVVGTPEYMSPEQADGKDVDGRSDVYSLGVVLYEMLTGRVPFRADTPVAVLYSQLHESPPAPSRVNPAVSRAVEQVILKALSKGKPSRYRSAGEMAEAMARAIQKQKPARTTTPWPWATRLLMLGAVGVLGTLLVFWLGPGRQGKQHSTATLTQATSTRIPTSTRVLTASRTWTRVPSPTNTSRPTATPTPRLTETQAPPTEQPTVPAATPTAYARANTGTDRLNVRSGPGMEYDILTKVHDGELVILLGRDSSAEWLKVRAPDATEGWSSAEWVKTNVNTNSLPVLPAPPKPEQPAINPQLRADHTTIGDGECTTLRWDADGIQALYLDGQGVAGHGSRVVCPSSTQTFTLLVVQRDGQRVPWPLTVSVSGVATPVSFTLEHQGCKTHSLRDVGQVKGRVFDRNGNIIANAYVDITVNGQAGVVPAARSNEQGWYEWNLRPGQVARFVRLTVNGLAVSFSPSNYEVTATSGCYQCVDFRQR